MCSDWPWNISVRNQDNPFFFYIQENFDLTKMFPPQVSIYIFMHVLKVIHTFQNFSLWYTKIHKKKYKKKCIKYFDAHIKHAIQIIVYVYLLTILKYLLLKRAYTFLLTFWKCYLHLLEFFSVIPKFIYMLYWLSYIHIYE